MGVKISKLLPTKIKSMFNDTKNFKSKLTIFSLPNSFYNTEESLN